MNELWYREQVHSKQSDCMVRAHGYILNPNEYDQEDQASEQRQTKASSHTSRVKHEQSRAKDSKT